MLASTEQALDVQPKKSKMVIGGFVKGWQKAVGIIGSKATKSTARGRSDSNASMPSLISSRASSITMSSAKSSVVSLPMGEFDSEETPASLLAARGSKSANAIADATAKMGISLVPKDVQLKADGKNSYANDLKFWQGAVIVEFVSWAGTKDETFAVNSHPDFRDVVTELWNHHFGAYPINDAVYAQAAAAVRNWRSKIGKTGVKTVQDVVTNSDDLSTIEARAEWVQNKLLDSNFDMTGAYRGELVLRTFAAHLQVVNKADVFYGHPVGALATACASAERALHMYKTGTCSTDGITRKGRRSANSFVAVPWAARAKAYLPGIKKLSDQKWAKIMALSIPFIDGAAQIAADDTEGDESEDHRGLIQISDDSDDEPAIEA
ncbi:hypothetical protein MVEN_00500000 [Mycena venus]|uniref:Uncharacterized protein n=1 Tax=Mycena venus TaxID=2733690 RepID=A0A8H6YS69_9AGAR|nr:hypothetical protein MVEN_00500000 [Mycena venus]